MKKYLVQGWEKIKSNIHASIALSLVFVCAILLVVSGMRLQSKSERLNVLLTCQRLNLTTEADFRRKSNYNDKIIRGCKKIMLEERAKIKERRRKWVEQVEDYAD